MVMNDMMEGFAKASESAIPVNDGDYVDEEGLLCCGKCHTRKQTRIEFNGKVLTPRCICKCEQERRKAEEEELKRQERMIKIREFRKMGFPDAEMARCTFEKDDLKNEKVTSIAKNYVANFDEMRKRNKGLLFFGEVGTGKTFLSACIANALIDKGYPCLVTNFARLTNTISGMYDGKQEYIDGLDRFSLLVIDDLASERDTEYMNEIVMNIIDSRYRSGKPLIVTTNLTSEELKHPQDVRKQRVYSRLLEMCLPIHVEGKDRRKEKLKEDYQELNRLLGL